MVDIKIIGHNVTLWHTSSTNQRPVSKSRDHSQPIGGQNSDILPSSSMSLCGQVQESDNIPKSRKSFTKISSIYNFLNVFIATIS